MASNNTIILPCNPCNPNSPAAEFQNGRYGQGQRVHNVDSKDKPSCTVCGKQKG